MRLNLLVGILGLILVASIAVIVTTNIVSFERFSSTYYEQVADNQYLSTRFAATQITDEVHRQRMAITALSRYQDLPRDRQCAPIADDQELSVIMVTNELGTVVGCTNEDYQDLLGINVQQKDYFQQAVKTKEPYVTDAMRSGDQDRIIISAPTYERDENNPYPNVEGQFTGIIYTIIGFDDLFHRYLHPATDANRREYLLLDAQTSKTISMSAGLNGSAILQAESLPLGSRMARVQGMGRTIITGVDFSVEGHEWQLFLLAPVTAYDGELKKVQRRHVVGLGIVALMFIAVFALLLRLYRSQRTVRAQLHKAEATLKGLGIDVAYEEQRHTEADTPLTDGNIYLLRDDPTYAYELFVKSLNTGHAGLGFVREDIAKLRTTYGLEKTSLLALRTDAIHDIKDVRRLAQEFLAQGKPAVILMDRLDYLLQENSDEEVLKGIRALKDALSGSEHQVIINVHTDVVSETALSALTLETTDVFRKASLTEQEGAILRFINERNNRQLVVSYSDVSREFDITKPTTRNRLRRLESLGLISVEQQGRYKALKITIAGRKLL